MDWRESTMLPLTTSMADTASKQRSRRDPAPNDFVARVVQLQRIKAAGDTRPRPKTDRTPLASSAKPQEPPRDKHPAPKDDTVRDRLPPRDEFARNMPAQTATARLFNPNFDTIRRTQEPENMSDIDSGSPPKSAVSRSHLPTSRRLFDPKRDPPVRFALLSRPSGPSADSSKPPPSHRSSGDYVSASSTSSYPPSLGSSAFTLTSASSSSSFASASKDKENPNSPVVAQLKRLYRLISHAEGKLLDEKHDDQTDEPVRVVLQCRDNPITENPDRWARLIAEHKELAELMHNFLTLTLQPQVPVSFHGHPTKYNIPSRLWTNAFHRILEALRRASLNSPLALEHLSDLIYYAYNFYTGLLENPVLHPYRSGWLEALGDLARYRMAVAAHLATTPFGARMNDRPQALFTSQEPRIDDSSNPSIGPGAALALEVEPERETWRKTARGWYAQGLRDTPGLGRLHHHLAVVSRESEDEEMRAVYHFVKSTMTSNPFPNSRESVLAMFTPQAQARRIQPDAKTADLFLLLHGMLFTHIQLDDFAPTHARFVERLALEGAEEREWIMMALINLGAVLEYGRNDGAIRNATLVAALGGRPQTASEKKVIAVVSRTEDLRIADNEEEKKMDVDEPEENGHIVGDTPQILSPDVPEPSHSFHLALELTFTTFSYTLRNPWRKTNAFARPSLNPYITVILTFLCTLLKNVRVLALLERAIPWDDLAAFLNTIPRGVVNTELELGVKGLTHGCGVLPEDWCLRGTEWMRRVYEYGFWKTETTGGEVDVLDTSEENAECATDGIIEEDKEDQEVVKPKETARRWVRSFRAGVHLVRAVDGFDWNKAEKRWKVEGVLREKVEQWKEIEQKEREEEEERRMRGSRWEDDMEIDKDEAEEAEVEEEDSDDEEDSEEVKELKARRRHFRALLLAAQRGESPLPRRKPSGRRRPTSGSTRVPLRVVAGYSVLVVDTNILLSSLSMFSSLVESLRWTIVVPLAVITELDGLSSNDSQLGTAATTALTYLISHIRSHSITLKVQTSRGNYLSSLSVRREQIDLRDSLSWERNMDDLILRAAIWQDEHWVDRSALLKAAPAKAEDMAAAARVVLLSFDRNLRLKARSRRLDAADEKDMAAILSAGT